MRGHKPQNCHKVVRLWDCMSEFFEERLKVLLGGLLAVKTLLVMKWFVAARDGDREPEIAFGFSHPPARGPFHKEPCPYL